MKLKTFFIAVLIMAVTAITHAQEIRSVKAVELEKIIAESKTPMVINFWATYCIPCIEEIPYFQEEVKKHAKDGVQLLLVSLDLKSSYPEKIKTFVKKRQFTAPMVWLNETDADYFCPKVDPKWTGSLPATLFINNKKGYRKFFEEEIPREKLQKEITAIL
jgi:thiol-disulfide isomerase/thioredoxin